MKERHYHNQKIASAKAGLSERTGRRIEKTAGLPSQAAGRPGRTRKDPLEAVWDSEVLPLLEASPGLKAISILEELELRHPDEDWRSRRRTVERRMREWHAFFGKEKEVIFRQDNPPGAMGLSDFTDTTSLNITIAGELLEHRLYHFALAYSSWEHAEVVLGGESFAALSQGVQNALHNLGGVPWSHRTDSLSAAFRNLTADEEKDVTERYKAMCAHYGMEATRNNKGIAHENGCIESHHGHLKKALDQALLLRGSRDFDSLDAYRLFLSELISRRNKRRKDQLRLELPALKVLPQDRTVDYDEATVIVTSTGGFVLRRVFYTVPSRLIGHRMKVRLYDDRLECYLASSHILTLPRGRRPKQGNGYVIDYRHVIHSLRRKPQAFLNLVYRDSVFPGSAYTRMWEMLSRRLEAQIACRVIVGLLALAFDTGREKELGHILDDCLEKKTLPDLAEIRQQLQPEQQDYPDVSVELPETADYNRLLGGLS